MRLVRHTVLPGDITSPDDVPAALGLMVTVATMAPVVAVAATVHRLGWLWGHPKVLAPLGLVLPGLAAWIGPRVVGWRPQWFVGPRDARRAAYERTRASRTAEQIAAASWPSAGQIWRGQRAGRVWLARRIAVLYLPFACLAAFGAVCLVRLFTSEPFADQFVRDEDFARNVALSVVWVVLVSCWGTAVVVQGSGPVRAALGAQAVGAKVLDADSGRRRAPGPLGSRRLRLVVTIRAVLSDGRMVGLAVVEPDLVPAAGDSFVLVGSLGDVLQGGESASDLRAVVVWDSGCQLPMGSVRVLRPQD